MEKEEEPRGGEPPIPELDGPKAKSCKGCLYYSSILRSDGRNPRCVGVPRTLKTVPGPNIVGESEMEATQEGRSLSDFRYVCVGYSVFLENKGSLLEPQTTKAELPFCVGVEVLVDRRVSTADNVSAPAHRTEDGHVFSKPRSHKPAHSMGDEFLTRFKRNAGIVASGVAKNLQRVGNYVKDCMDDVMYPYRRRPK